ncbi:MAG: hypothetical protein V2I47_04265 [Bacteroidales bacterium]|jgi:hypothetical protein|nr:hypothetical protein [Bacteroidales bacterium]
MLRFILYLIAGTAAVFMLSYTIRYLLKASHSWDTWICKKRGTSFCGFRWHYRIPWAIGVVPEFFYFQVLGRNNYFNARWWSLRASAYISFLLFLAIIFAKNTVADYYSLSYFRENGILAYIEGSSSFMYLNLVNFLFVALFILILIESIRMHAGWSPVRLIFYTLLCAMMAFVNVLVLALLISFTFLYVCYKIIKFFLTSRRRYKVDVDDDDSPSDKLNNRFRRFRAELYEWERERKATIEVEKEERKTVIKRKRPRIERKPKKKYIDDDIPRIYPG